MHEVTFISWHIMSASWPPGSDFLDCAFAILCPDTAETSSHFVSKCVGDRERHTPRRMTGVQRSGTVSPCPSYFATDIDTTAYALHTSICLYVLAIYDMAVVPI